MSKTPTFFQSLVPIIFLMGLLSYNIFFQDGEWLGEYSNHLILLISGILALIFGLMNEIRLSK
ncbi:MAG: NhaC family Na+:H+ antiporter, partial [Flavobacteriales bacterium]